MTNTWETIRDEAIAAFQESLGAKLEDTIRTQHSEDPERVERAIRRIIKAHQRKHFDSPWAVVRADLTRTTVTVTVNADASRQRLITQAKQWIHNAGCHHQTFDECAAELFGINGLTAELAYLEHLEHDTRDNEGRAIYDSLLHASIVRAKLFGREPIPDNTNALLYTYRDDHDARAELEAEWATARVAAVKAEADHEAWNTKCKQDRAAIEELRAQQIRALTARQTADDERRATLIPHDDDIQF